MAMNGLFEIVLGLNRAGGPQQAAMRGTFDAFLMTSERMVKSFRTLTRPHYTRFCFRRQPPIAG